MSKPDLQLRKELTPGWINLAVGEPRLVSINLKSVLDKHGVNNHIICNNDILTHEYKPSTGIPELVEFLKNKTGYKYVVITNGAKQAISASFAAVKAQGYDSVYIPVPYWVSFPTLALKEDLNVIHSNTLVDDQTAILLTLPNNPDGYMMNQQDFDAFNVDCQADNLPLIHDGAYNSKIYLPTLFGLENSCSMYIHSYSKSLGLSGLRIGYLATNNATYAELASEYMEITTTGVSSASQQIVLKLEQLFDSKPEIYNDFVTLCQKDFAMNRTVLKTLHKDIADVKFMSPNGMFAFLPKGPKCDKAFEAAKVKVLNGDLFGKPGYVRISLGLEPQEFKEAVDRVNAQI